MVVDIHVIVQLHILISREKGISLQMQLIISQTDSCVSCYSLPCKMYSFPKANDKKGSHVLPQQSEERRRWRHHGD